MSMPEEIWAFCTTTGHDVWARQEVHKATSYTRSDIHQALHKQIADLTEALEFYAKKYYSRRIDRQAAQQVLDKYKETKS